MRWSLTSSCMAKLKEIYSNQNKSNKILYAYIYIHILLKKYGQNHDKWIIPFDQNGSNKMGQK
jgi:hypothetical protein